MAAVSVVRLVAVAVVFAVVDRLLMPTQASASQHSLTSVVVFEALQ
jgi:hypothetical protein